ncbi:hypothetical protein GN956_G9592 [Arapaima gigas]
MAGTRVAFGGVSLRRRCAGRVTMFGLRHFRCRGSKRYSYAEGRVGKPALCMRRRVQLRRALVRAGGGRLGLEPPTSISPSRRNVCRVTNAGSPR